MCREHTTNDEKIFFRRGVGRDNAQLKSRPKITTQKTIQSRWRED
jgi:hypothetical protein